MLDPALRGDAAALSGAEWFADRPILRPTLVANCEKGGLAMAEAYLQEDRDPKRRDRIR